MCGATRTARIGYAAELARWLHPARIKNGWLLVIDAGPGFGAYVDAGGTHESARYFSLAVYCARADAWGWFENDWRRVVIDECGLKRMHMTQLESKFQRADSPFRGWDRDRKDAFLAKLIPIIHRHVEMGFVDVVDRRAYRQVLISPFETCLEQFKRDFTDHHVLAFWSLIGFVYQQFKPRLAPGERIKFLLDQEKEALETVLRRHFRQMIRDNPHMTDWIDPDLAFVSSTEFVPLQASDILAWEAANEMRQQGRIGRNPRRLTLDALELPSGRALVHYFTPLKMVRLRAKAERRRIL
jgi:hypothetical protein